MRYLAIDLGDKRTGLAIADAFTRLVTPLDVIEIPIARREGEDLLAALAAAVDKHVSPRSPCELVVGLPFNMDGSEGQRAKLVRAFADRIGARTSRAVRFQDERLTSIAADWSMARSGMTHADKKAKRDALAAAIILRDFLESLDRPQTDAEPPPSSGV